MKKSEQEKGKDDPSTKKEGQTSKPEKTAEVKPSKKKVPGNIKGISKEYLSSGEPKVEKTPEPEKEAGLLGRIKEKVENVVKVDLEDSKQEGRKSPTPSKKLNKKESQDFMEASKIILSPFLIIAVGQALGETCQPTKEEADQFVEPLSRIIARHVPMPETMSADVIDILSMASVVIIWYGRVQNDLPWSKGGGGGGSDRPPAGPSGGGGDGRATKQDDERAREALRGSSLEGFL